PRGGATSSSISSAPRRSAIPPRRWRWSNACSGAARRNARPCRRGQAFGTVRSRRLGRACARLADFNPRRIVMATRRRFVSTTAWSTAALALAPLAACSQEPPAPAASSTPSPRPAEPPPAAAGTMLMRTIPSSGESIPAIGVGTSGSYEVPLDSPEFSALKEVLATFFDGGGRVIDTSPNYSNAEDVVGALLEQGGWRERC